MVSQMSYKLMIKATSGKFYSIFYKQMVLNFMLKSHHYYMISINVNEAIS